MKKENIIFIIIKIICFIFVGTIINLLVHELSLLLILLFVNGEPIKFSLGAESFVGGYVDVKYISVVSLASIYIPTIISFSAIFIKNKYLQLLNAGFTVQIMINCIMGVFTTIFINDSYQRSTFDVSLAIDNMSMDIIAYIIIILSLFCSVFAIIKSFKVIGEMA